MSQETNSNDIVQIPLDLSAPVNNLILLRLLRDLNYDKQVQNNENPQMQQITSTSFCFPASAASEQFLMFSSLASWLLGECGDRNLAGRVFTDFDEPTSVITELLAASRKYVDVHDLSPAKLKLNYGQSVCAFLVGLARAALGRKTILTGSVRPQVLTWSGVSCGQQLIQQSQPRVNNLVIANNTDIEVGLYDIVPTTTANDNGLIDIDIGVLSQNTKTSMDSKNNIAGDTKENRTKSSNETTTSAFVPVDPKKWAMEVRSVESALRNAVYDKISGDVGSNSTTQNTAIGEDKDTVNEWLKKLVVLVNLANRIQKDASNIDQPLNIILTNFQQHVARVAAREQLLNDQISPSSNGLLQVATKHSLKMEESRYLRMKIAEITETLAKVGEDLAAAKQKLSVDSSKMSDVAPLRKVKSAIIALTSEIRQLDLKIALAQQKLFADTTTQSF